MGKMLRDKGEIPHCLIPHSDGRPDHNVTFHSVKLLLIVLFKMLVLDFLAAGRTAPIHS